MKTLVLYALLNLEGQCPRCGRGRFTGITYPGCSSGHALWCRRFNDDVCDECALKLGW